MLTTPSPSSSPSTSILPNPLFPSSEGEDNSSLLLPEPSRYFHSEIYGGRMMLSPDKVISCAGQENSTTISDNPGATILSPILLSLAGISGQIIALVYLHRQTRPSYGRTVFYVMLATLIWTDLIGKVITTPPAILSYAYGKWVGGMKMCNLHGFSMITIGLVTHFLVSAMAVDRFLCVRHGYFYRTNVTKSRARLILMSIWIFALVFCSLPLFGMGELEPQYPGTWCFLNIHVTDATPWHLRLYTNLYGILNVINLLIIVSCNLIVIGTLISARTSRSRKLSAAVASSSKSSYQRELEIQMVIVLVVITAVFLSSWSPLDLRLFLNQIWPHLCREDHFSDLVAIRLASVNQIVDPWVYIICRRIFISRVWRGCRTTFVGRGFSSLKKEDLKKQISHNIERGKLTPEVGKLGVPQRGFERRHSIPTMELCKVTLMKQTEVELKRLVAPLAVNEQYDDVFRDSGTASGRDEASYSSDDCGECHQTVQNVFKGYAKDMSKDIADAAFLEIPIPLFVKEQYRVSLKSCPVTNRRGNRLFSSTSAQSGPTYVRKEQLESEKRLKRLPSRSHSWSCCSATVYKQFRSQSTQTSKEDEEDEDSSTYLDEIVIFK